MLIREAVESDAIGIAEVLHDISKLQSATNMTVEQTCARVATALARAVASQASTVLAAVVGDGAIAGYCSAHWAPFSTGRCPSARRPSRHAPRAPRSVAYLICLIIATRTMTNTAKRINIIPNRRDEVVDEGATAGEKTEEGADMGADSFTSG